MSIHHASADNKELSASAAHPEIPERMKERPVFQPNVDIHESDKAITLLADLPGVDRNAVEVTLEKNVLTLRARAEPKTREGMSRVYAEYEIGDFERAFTVSDDVDPDAISAAVHNGLLTVTLPKRAPRNRRISVSGE